MTDDKIKAVFESYGQYVTGKEYALVRAIVAAVAPQRKPLPVDKDGWHWLTDNECIHVDLIRKVEAAHGIKE